MKVRVTLDLTVEDDADMEALTQRIVDLVNDDWLVDLAFINSVDDGQWTLGDNS